MRLLPAGSPMTRRKCLSKFAAVALPLVLPMVSRSEQSDARTIRIADHETFVVHVNARGNWVLVRLATDAGIKGLGEASMAMTPTLCDMLACLHSG